MNESAIAKKSVCFLKTLTFGFSLICIACPSVAFAYDFTLSAYGPNRVVQGHDLYVQEVSAITDSTGITDGGDYAYFYVDGLPTGATASWPTLDEYCCGGNKGWRPTNALLKINVPSTTPAGTYPLTLRLESAGVKKQIPYTLVVSPVPNPLPEQIINIVPPIPALSTWENQMTTYGQKLCDDAKITSLGMWEGNVWYYDGMRVFHQIADYTKNSSWNDCAGYVKKLYQPYAMAGGVPGWRVFPHGLYQDYLRNNDITSKDAVIKLSTNSAYATKGGGVSFGNGDEALQRDTAYLIHAYRIAGLLGNPNTKLYARSVDFVLGMIDQMFISKTDSYLKPFMMGLMMEALIQYYEETKDPRVPPAIKAALDGLWTRAWIPANKAFYYESTDPAVASPDLNLLIAPAFAWIYKLTGDPVYQQQGDLIFQGGVEGSWLDQGKQFNQNYRWSFDYVKWRLNPGKNSLQAPTSLRIAS